MKKLLKAAVSGAMLLLMAGALTACGKSGKEETVQANNEVESTPPPMQEYTSEEDTEVYDEMEDEQFITEEICSLYNEYLQEGISEDELEALLDSMYQVSIDEAKSIFEENAEELGYGEVLALANIPYFEASEEIKNASLSQFKFQVADMNLGMFTKMSDCMEQIENSELPLTYDYNPDKLIIDGSADSVTVYLGEEPYLSLLAVNFVEDAWVKGETLPIKECIVNSIEIKDYSNVYYAGGIPALDMGISRDEYDALVQEDFGELMPNIERRELISNGHYQIEYAFKNSFSHGYVLACEGFARECSDYTYTAQFDDTGTSLEKIEMLTPDTVPNFANLGEDNIVIER